jgi:alpha-N-arabinofuranosidase
MEWDRTVLEYVGEFADYISLHRYVGDGEGDVANYLAVTHSIDRQIEEMDAACRYVQARLRSKKRHYLCFDEWNVWYRTTTPEHMNGRGQFAPPLIEEQYDLADALVVAGFLNSFIRHADVVKIANLAQIVNVIAPIQTRGDELLLHTIYDPFVMYASRREGVSLQPVVKGPGYESRNYGHVNFIDTSAILGEGVLHVFLVNRSLDQTAPVTLDFVSGKFKCVQSAEVFTGPGAASTNTYEQPGLVHTRPLGIIALQSSQATMNLPPLSVAALTFEIKG